MYQENTGAQAQPESFQASSITAVAADPCPGHFQRRALDLFDAGYRVTLLPAGCKGPVDRGWQVTTERQTRDGVEAMVRHAPPGAGVGILARWTPAVDLDVQDVELVRKLAELARRKLGWTVERVGQAPKVLLPYKTSVPFAKKRLAFRLPDGSSHAIEVLCDGQQWVCFHKHPNTGRPYMWLDGELPPRDELSEITEGGAVEFLDAA